MKKNLSKLKTLIFLIFTITSILSGTVHAASESKIQSQITQYTEKSESNIVVMRSDIIDWRFKLEDGKLYKRLYNYTRERWEGEWILCSI